MAQHEDKVETPVEPLFTVLHDLTEDDKQDLLDEYLKKFSDSRKFMQNFYATMIKQYKRYRSIADPIVDELGREVKGRANLYVPYPWAIVESELPRLSGKLPRVRAFPRKRAERIKVEAIQNLLYYTFDRMEFIRLNILWQRQQAIYGWSPLFYFWRLEERTVLEREIDEQGNSVLRKVPARVWDDFYARVLDVFDCFMQPGVEEIEESDYFMFREWLSEKDLLQRVEGGTLYEEVKEYLEDNESGFKNNEAPGRVERDELLGITRNISDSAYGKHELLYVLEDDRIICILNRDILARSGDNPHPRQEKALINLKLMPLISEPIGISTIEALGGLPEKLNALTNTRLDNLSLIMNKVIIANRFSNTDFKNLKFTAGNVILTNDTKSLEFLDVPDIGQSSEREIFSTKEEMQFVSGVSDFIVGTNSSSRLADTATGVSTIVREANARFALKLSTFEGGALRKLVTAAHVYNMLYMPKEKIIHVLGPKGYTLQNVTLEEIMCDCEFIVEPGSSIPLDQLTRRQALTNLFGLVQAVPQIVDMGKYVKEVFDAHDIRNPDELILEKDGLPELDDANLAQAENVALRQGQSIDLQGNDQLHLGIHGRVIQEGEVNSWPEQMRDALLSHMTLHIGRIQAIQAQQAQQVVAQPGGQENAGQPGAGGGSALQNPARSSQEAGQGQGVQSSTGVSQFA